jgi:hypothetical protein
VARLAIRLRGCHVPTAVGVGLVQPIAAREAVAATGEHQRPLAVACHRPDVRKHLAGAGEAASEVGPIVRAAKPATRHGLFRAGVAATCCSWSTPPNT